MVGGPFPSADVALDANPNVETSQDIHSHCTQHSPALNVGLGVACSLSLGRQGTQCSLLSKQASNSTSPPMLL